MSSLWHTILKIRDIEKLQSVVLSIKFPPNIDIGIYVDMTSITNYDKLRKLIKHSLPPPKKEKLIDLHKVVVEVQGFDSTQIFELPIELILPLSNLKRGFLFSQFDIPYLFCPITMDSLLSYKDIEDYNTKTRDLRSGPTSLISWVSYENETGYTPHVYEPFFSSPLFKDNLLLLSSLFILSELKEYNKEVMGIEEKPNWEKFIMEEKRYE